jgi:endogenous inhibitor of DNA gyrase (YacG/DUF329 family)
MRSRAKASMSASPPDTRKCAICGKPQDEAYRPFCSKRCADIDLGRWLKGNYSIPGGPADEADNVVPNIENPSNDD